MPSKFIEQVQATITLPERHRAQYSHFPDLRVDENYEQGTPTMHSASYDVRYCIGVHWDRFVYAQPADIPHLKEAIVSELNHDVYGSFIRDLLRIKYHIRCREVEVANELIEQLLREVTL